MDLPARKPIKQIEAGHYIEGLDFSRDGKRLYIMNGERQSYSVVDTSNHQVVRTIKLQDEPHDALVTPDGRFLYITLPHKNAVAVHSLPDYKEVAFVKQGLRPDLISFTPDGALAYISNRDSKEVWVMDARKHVNLRKIRTGNGAHGVVVVPAPAPKPIAHRQ